MNVLIIFSDIFMLSLTPETKMLYKKSNHFMCVTFFKLNIFYMLESPSSCLCLRSLFAMSSLRLWSDSHLSNHAFHAFF